MRKYLAMLCAGMLFACCLALGACSGSGSSSAAASSSASASAASASASSSAGLQASFEGTWKLAAVESQGITMTGDFSSIVGSKDGMAMTIKPNGTGELNMNGETAAFTWTQKGFDAITLDVKAADASASSASAASSGSAASAMTVDVVMEGGALFMAMDQDTFSGNAIFTTDGTYAGAKEITSASMTPITSEDALVGSWTLSGINMMGITMYGDAKDLAAMAGGQDVSLSFEKGGKCHLMGSDATYAVSSDGATITEENISIPVKALGDEIAIDMTDLIGMEMIMVFSK